MNTIRDIGKHGQSIWFDYIERALVWTGELYRMVEEDGLRGVTSNPSIFEKAIGSSSDYRPALEALVRRGESAISAFETLARTDLQLALDVFRKVHDESDGRDGFVSLEVSPHLAKDTAGTVLDGQRLWHMVGRKNLMIKVPATEEGIPAIEELIARGINVNVTLLFSVERYEAVLNAYMAGLERRLGQGQDISRVASVASFFVSRIDSMVDKMIDERLSASPSSDLKSELERVRGKTAIANAKMAYASYQRISGEERWKALQEQGARPQRLLWASTSTKNPEYRDVLYVEELIGPDTVNTVPAKTYQAFKDHGRAEATLTTGLEEAQAVMQTLGKLDISMKQVTDRLVDQGVILFREAFDRLLATVETRRRELLGSRLARMIQTESALIPVAQNRLDALTSGGFSQRLWKKDAKLFSDDPQDAGGITGFMGWLDAVSNLAEQPEAFLDLQEDLEVDGVTHVVVMGMGGSSLAPEVFAKVFKPAPGSPKLVVLDSTVPAQILSVQKRIDPDHSVFIVASKSGTTAEPLAFQSYFFDQIQDGDRFMAVTDPETRLEHMAVERDYQAIFNGDPEIGGRYSALSPFGLVPACAMGLDVIELLETADLMVASCGADIPPSENPGVRLGVILGELAKSGRDKLTISASESLSPFGAWLEQLIAESTGKKGVGIVPVDGERLSEPKDYSDDRVFVHFRLEHEPEELSLKRLESLEKAGHPVLSFELSNPQQIVQEMFRWEIATATAAHILGVNPFDQPNVEESKRFTKEYLKAFESQGTLPEVDGEEEIFRDQDIVVYTDASNATGLRDCESLGQVLREHVDRSRRGDYVALNAYVESNDVNDASLQTLRHAIRDRKKCATTLGYGPRFLHSTGQLHKGGPDTGVFIQITSDDAEDIPVPGASYSFGVLKQAQERGDFTALSKRGRRILRVHLPADVEGGLKALVEAWRSN